MIVSSAGKSALSSLFGGGNSDSSDDDEMGGLFLLGTLEDEEIGGDIHRAAQTASIVYEHRSDEAASRPESDRHQINSAFSPRQQVHGETPVLPSRRRSRLHAPSKEEIFQLQGGAARCEGIGESHDSGYVPDLDETLRDLEGVLRTFPPPPSHSVDIEETSHAPVEGSVHHKLAGAVPPPSGGSSAGAAGVGGGGGLTSAVRSLFGAATRRW